jgi:hypothetical protein
LVEETKIPKTLRANRYKRERFLTLEENKEKEERSCVGDLKNVQMIDLRRF